MANVAMLHTHTVSAKNVYCSSTPSLSAGRKKGAQLLVEALLAWAQLGEQGVVMTTTKTRVWLLRFMWWEII